MKLAMYVCVNKRFIPLLVLFLESFKNNANIKTKYDFYCFVDRLSIVPEYLKNKYEWVKFRETKTTNIQNYTSWDSSFFYGMSIKVFALYELMNDYDRIIYLDVDIIINGDLNDFVHCDLGGRGIGAVPDFQTNRRDKRKINLSHVKTTLEYRDTLVGSNELYFNSGVYIIDDPTSLDEIRYDEFATRFKPSLVDQDYLNYVYRGDVCLIPEKYNFMCDNTHLRDMSYQDRMIDSYNMSIAPIQHFHGSSKPWKCKSSFGYFELVSQMNTVRFFETYDSVYDIISSNVNYDWIIKNVDRNRELLQRTDRLAINFGKYKSA